MGIYHVQYLRAGHEAAVVSHKCQYCVVCCNTVCNSCLELRTGELLVSTLLYR